MTARFAQVLAVQLLAVQLLAVLPGTARAQQVRLDFETNGFCAAPPLALNGTASFGALFPCPLVLTPGDSYDAGSAWTVDTLALGPASVVRVRFHATISGGLSAAGSGLAFGWYDGPSTGLGGTGYGLGLEGLAPSLAVEFDTYRSTTVADPNGNHLGIDLDGSLFSIATPTPTFDLDAQAGGFWVWVEAYQATGELLIWADPGPVRPATPLATIGMDLVDVVGSAPRLGFTASTGDDPQTDEHRIDSWLVEIDDDTDGDRIMDFEDLCQGDDATGDTDLDGTCDDLDPCPDDPLDDRDGDGACDSADPCPDDPYDDSDGDTVCDSGDRCPGADDTLDADADGVPDCLPETGDTGLTDTTDADTDADTDTDTDTDADTDTDSDADSDADTDADADTVGDTGGGSLPAPDDRSPAQSAPPAPRAGCACASSAPGGAPWLAASALGWGIARRAISRRRACPSPRR